MMNAAMLDLNPKIEYSSPTLAFVGMAKANQRNDFIPRTLPALLRRLEDAAAMPIKAMILSTDTSNNNGQKKRDRMSLDLPYHPILREVESRDQVQSPNLPKLLRI